MLKAIYIVVAFIASQQCFGEGLRVSTQPGLEVGVQASRYKYEEPGTMSLSGRKVGVASSYTALLPKDSFVTVDGRIAYGQLFYDGRKMFTGAESKHGQNPDLSVEVRIVVGEDFFPGAGESFSLSPFVGVGYRFLFSHIGYNRYSEYWYVPIGLRSRIRTREGFTLVPTVEYDWFLKGSQKAEVAGFGPSSPQNQGSQGGELGCDCFGRDFSSKQNHGRGYRASLMLETGVWSFGLWLHVWKIERSGDEYDGGGWPMYEPKNSTREFGLEVRKHF